jgi:hypothetical protein
MVAGPEPAIGHQELDRLRHLDSTEPERALERKVSGEKQARLHAARVVDG